MMVKKICLLGSFAVGKTSLVSQFVSGQFSDKYLTTLGVKIDKKMVETAQGRVNLQVWDLAGDDAYQRLQMSYLRGSSGFLFVADGTRAASLAHAREVLNMASDAFPGLPALLLLNKCDLIDQWEIGPGDLEVFEARTLSVQQTSAKTGEGVEAAFQALASAMMRGK